MELKPMPAFYCCYLLRSTKHATSLYVGSTPNPRRRLAQHNGEKKGGAVRTKHDGLRPWEMSCLVTGFPSNIAALQFEWSWQNTHLTRRIPSDQRISIREAVTKINKKTGIKRTRYPRPKPTLRDKLINLHLLLRVPSFARWPLEIRFFSEDVYNQWLNFTQPSSTAIRKGFRIVQDYKTFPKPRKNAEADRKAEAEAIKKAQIADALQRLESLPMDYAPMKEYISKSLSLLTKNQSIGCSVCTSSVDTLGNTTIICPMPDCNAVSHIKCLAASFIEDATDGDLVPSTGSCPKCKTTLNWVHLARATSLRIRGAKDVARLMRKPRQKKQKEVGPALQNGSTNHAGALDLEEDDQDTESEDDLENLDISGIVDEPLIDEAGRRGIFQDDDALSATSEASDTSYIDTPKKPQFRVPKLPTVIEDSDCDDIEILL